MLPDHMAETQTVTARRDDGVSLRRTEDLIHILRPVIAFLVEVHAAGRPDPADNYDHTGWTRWMTQEHAENNNFMREIDEDLLAEYDTIDTEIAAIEAQRQQHPRNSQPWHDEGYRRSGIEVYKTFHVLNRLQETWLVKFTVDLSALDTWGRTFMTHMNTFGAALQRLTALLHTRVTADSWTQQDGFPENPLNADINTQWENTAMHFVRLLLFLFDVGITLEAGSDNTIDRDNPQFIISPPFTSPAVLRSRVLDSIHFVIYLEVCAWKVLTVSSLASPHYTYQLAIPNVCRELCTRISAVKDTCLQAEGRHHFLDNLDRTRCTERRRVIRAITTALEWRDQWEGPHAVEMLQQYRAALVPLQQDFTINLAHTFTQQDTPNHHDTHDDVLRAHMRDMTALLQQMKGLHATDHSK